MDWITYLSDDLINVAYRFHGEAAWNRRAAIRVLNVLKKKAVTVLGVDIWVPTANGPRIPSQFVYDLDLTASAIGDRETKSASEFIEHFKWSEDDLENRNCEPFFCIVAENPNN